MRSAWDEKFRLDVWYVDNHDLLLDLRILWLTCAKVFAREGISAAGEATMTRFTGSQPWTRQVWPGNEAIRGIRRKRLRTRSPAAGATTAGRLRNESWDLVFVDDSPGAPAVNGHRVLRYEQWLDEPAAERLVTIAIANSRVRERLRVDVKRMASDFWRARVQCRRNGRCPALGRVQCSRHLSR